MGADFIEAVTRAMVNVSTEDMNLPTLETHNSPRECVGVKAPMFSFTRLLGSDPVIGVEMASTGEVACYGQNKEEAFLKSLLSTGFKMPEQNILISCNADLVVEMTYAAYQLHESGYTLYVTRETEESLQANHVPCTIIGYPTDKGKQGTEGHESENVLSMIKEKKIDMVTNIPTHKSKRLKDNLMTRRTAVDFGIALLTNLQLVKVFADAVVMHKKDGLVGLDPQSLFEHYEDEKDDDAWTNPKEFH